MVTVGCATDGSQKLSENAPPAAKEISSIASYSRLIYAAGSPFLNVTTVLNGLERGSEPLRCGAV